MGGTRTITPLKRILDEEGRRQNWLARQTGIHESEISRIVNGIWHADDGKRQAIARALGRQVDELFGAEATEEAAA